MLKITVSTVSLILLVACEGDASTLDPKGPGASRIEGLWWLVFWIATAVFVIVLALLLIAVLRARRKTLEVKKEVRWGEKFIILSGVVVPSLILMGVFAVSLKDSAALSEKGDEARLTIEVTSHDWWWEARYPNGAVTANEIHIPVGEPVRLELPTEDVIHSFWVPRLQAHTDHIPGRSNEMWIQADEPDRYRGQCAEFCGIQHANMLFYVVAQPRPEFDAWLADNVQPAEEAQGTTAEGERVFLETTCAGCHAVRGTPANVAVGPDLTHLAQRETLMAGIIPNTRDNLAQVITDPQSIKPGVIMPPTELSTGELEALLDYLEQLD